MNIDELLKFVYGLAEDHKPDGWPAIQMKEMTLLADEILKLREQNKAHLVSIESLNSEREMNSILTQENERLLEENAKLIEWISLAKSSLGEMN